MSAPQKKTITFAGQPLHMKLVDDKTKKYLPYAQQCIDDGGVIIAVERPARGDAKCYGYITFESHQEVIETMEGINEGDRVFNEHIPPNVPRRLPFDIDYEKDFGTVQKAEEFGKKLVVALYTSLFENFEMTYGSIITPNDLLVSSGCTPQKCSFHVVLDAGCMFDNYYETEDFVNKVFAGIPQKLLPYFDRGIYTSRRNFRILGANKLGKKNHLKKVKLPIGVQTTGISSPLRYFLTYKKPGDVILPAKTTYVYGEQPAISPLVLDDNLKQKILDSVADHPMIKDIFEFSKINGPFVTMHRLQSSFCNLCSREHDGLHTASNYLHITKTGDVLLRCFRDGTKGCFKLAAFQEQVETKTAALEFSLDENLFREDEGFADLIFQKLKGLVIHEGAKTGHLYNPETALWEPRDELEIRNRFSPILEEYVLYYKSVLEEKIQEATNSVEDDDPVSETKIEDWKEKVKILQKVRKSVLTDAKCRAIYNKVAPRYYNQNLIDKFDKDPFLLPIQGGNVVDLRTGKLRERVMTDYFTMECPVDLDIGEEKEAQEVAARRAKVETFFQTLFGKHAGLVTYMQRFLGYCLTGLTVDRSFYCFSGKGLNGKSSLIKIMRSILDGFYKTAEYSLLLVQAGKQSSERGGANPFLLEIGNTARMVVVSEPDRKARLNTGLIKQISSGDTAKTRKLYSQKTADVTFRCKLVIDTNYLPDFDGTDSAVNDRVKVVPFSTRFKKTKDDATAEGPMADDKLVEKMCGELRNAFFTYIVEGAASYFALQEKYIPLPECITEKRGEYIRENNPIDAFIEECCDVSKDGCVPTNQLFQSFKEYCIENNMPIGYSNIAFGKEITNKGFEKFRKQLKGSRGWVYTGIAIKEEEPETQRKIL